METSIVVVGDFSASKEIVATTFIARCSVELNVVVGITSNAVELNPGDFIEIEGTDEKGCLANIEACADSGVTLAFRLKVVELVENAVIFSSGAEKEDGYGEDSVQMKCIIFRYLYRDPSLFSTCHVCAKSVLV